MLNHVSRFYCKEKRIFLVFSSQKGLCVSSTRFWLSFPAGPRQFIDQFRSVRQGNVTHMLVCHYVFPFVFLLKNCCNMVVASSSWFLVLEHLILFIIYQFLSTRCGPCLMRRESRFAVMKKPRGCCFNSLSVFLLANRRLLDCHLTASQSTTLFLRWWYSTERHWTMTWIRLDRNDTVDRRTDGGALVDGIFESR